MLVNDLKQMERATFKAAADSGLWDVFLASLVAMFAIAPLLSGRMGDFWSSAVFLPAWAIVYVVIHLVQARVVKPRLGVVEFARPRRKRLTQLAVIMVVINVIALVLGIVASIRYPAGQIPVSMLALMPIAILAGFSLAAYFVEIPRLFAYGVLLAAAPFVGEVLFRSGHATHHGFPIVFGVSAVAILVCGVVRFVRFLPRRRGEGGSPLEANRG